MKEQKKPKKKYDKLIFYSMVVILLMAMTGCAKKNHDNINSNKGDNIKEENTKERIVQKDIEYLGDKESISNNPYNSFSKYFNGYTYIRKGMSICRIADGSDEIQQIYTDENAVGMGFTIHEKELYVYKILVDQETQGNYTEIIRMGTDGSSPVSILTYDGVTAVIAFYKDNMYLWQSGAETDRDIYKGYRLDKEGKAEELEDNETFLYNKVNEYFKEAGKYGGQTNTVLEAAFSMEHYGGIFYKEPQKTELPVWDIYFESEETTTDTLVEYYEDILITPYGIYKVSQDGNSILQCDLNGKNEKEVFINPESGLEIQLFTYDEKGIYFCIYGQEGDGTIYRISGETCEAERLFQLQEAGFTYNRQDSTQGPLFINVQNGYVYMWTNFLESFARRKI